MLALRFLLTFLIVILLILNGIGILLYRKKRQEFLNRPNRNNENIAMEELSTISTVNNDKTKYRPISVLSTITSNPSSSPMPNARSSYVNYPRHTIVPLPKITTIFETSEVSQEDDEEEEEEETTSPSNQTNNKSDMDLSLEVFQRQALKEHNAMRAMYRKPPFKLSESLNLYAQVKPSIHCFFSHYLICFSIGLNNVQTQIQLHHQELNGVCIVKVNQLEKILFQLNP